MNLLMKSKQLLFASAFLCVPVLFAGSNPKATGTFTYISNVDGSTATISLSAQQLDKTFPFQGRGTLFLQEAMGTLILDVKYVKVVNNVAYIASQVAEGSNYPGQSVGNWFFNVVVDAGEPGVGHDTIKGAGLGMDAENSNTIAMKVQGWLNDPKLIPAPPEFTVDLPITSGNIQVHNK